MNIYIYIKQIIYGYYNNLSILNDLYIHKQQEKNYSIPHTLFSYKSILLLCDLLLKVCMINDGEYYLLLILKYLIIKLEHFSITLFNYVNYYCNRGSVWSSLD